MFKKILPDIKFLHDCFSYDDDLGHLYWKKRPDYTFDFPDKIQRRDLSVVANAWNAKYSDRRAFTCLSKDNVYVGRINNVQYLAHRIIWKLLYNENPSEVYHRDMDGTNNKRKNLYTDRNSNYIIKFNVSTQLYCVISKYRNIAFASTDKLEAVNYYNEMEKL